jgi:hypothetical protein
VVEIAGPISVSDLMEVVHVELANKRGIVAVFEVFRQYFLA